MMYNYMKLTRKYDYFSGKYVYSSENKNIIYK